MEQVVRAFTHDDILELLTYSPDTGLFHWKERDVKWFVNNSRPAKHCALAWNNKHSGKQAFIDEGNNGYLFAKIFMSRYSAHRMAWFWMTEQWPDEVDHINGNRKDNRWSNLREVNRVGNSRNRRSSVNNFFGHYGVGYHKNSGRIRAYIGVGKKLIHLGYFDTVEDALITRRAAEVRYGFHENHKHVKA